MTTEVNKGGRLTLAQQAEHNHAKAETRVDLEMSKLTEKVIKHLAKMVNKIDTYKENTQLALVDKVLKQNKEYMKAKRELELANSKPKEEEVLEQEEDYTPMIDLSADRSKSTLN